MALNEQTDVKIDDHPHVVEGSEESEIQKMFSGSTVFLTGGTGFLGKLLVEKLLRSCPDIKKLYLLTRPKKNKDIKKRLQEQFDDVVKFIFHGAATVRFDEVLKKAVEINVRGTREILKLARACTKLRAFVYISTAYSNCHLNEIDEKFYGSNLSEDMLINLVENMDENTLKNITPGLLDNLPNTYTYSKLTAEDFVQKHSQGLPVLVTGGLGLLHSLHCNPQAIADMVPGDYVINGIIAAAWKTAKDYLGNYEHSPVDNFPIVYNYVSSEQTPITWDSEIMYHKIIRKICEKYSKKYTKDLQARMYGGTDRDICIAVVEELKMPISADEFERQLNDLAQKMLPSAPLQRGAERLLTHLHDYKIPMALATNSTEQAVRLHATARPKLFGLFHHKVSVNDPEVFRGKPNPDIYLVAASRFPEKPKPRQCLVFEDSAVGVIAAKEAGMQVVMIPDSRLDREQTRQATLVIRSLMNFQPELFGLPPFDDIPKRKSSIESNPD
ncbi:unnamed protein product, partial [Brenthis ino]